MRVLLVYPRVPYSFWTFEETLKLEGRKAVMPPLGLMTVAALLPRDWELRLIDQNVEEITESAWDWAQIVMISGMIVQAEAMLGLTKESRRRGKTVVAGGPYASLVPDELMAAGADFVVKGEGETALPLWLEALAAGETGIIVQEPSKPDMTTSPVPRFDLARLKAYAVMPIQTSRGCPYNCEFCDIAYLYGRKPRYKGPKQVLAELETLLLLGWRHEIFFSDDNFIGSKQRARALLTTLIPWMKAHGEPFSFWTQASIDLGQDRELIDLMTAANFGPVFIGIESLEEEVLETAGKHQNLKNPLAESILNINANGLEIVGSFIIGLDNERKGVDEGIRSFVEQTNIPLVLLNTLQALPNTDLWRRLKRENRLLDERSDGVSTGGRLNFVPTCPAAEITEEYLRLTDSLYEPSAFLRRSYRYYLTMRPTRKALGIETETADSLVFRKAPLREKLRDLKCLLTLLWRQGIVGKTRVQFWRQLIGTHRANPSRLTQCLVSLSLGENLFQSRIRELSKFAEDRESRMGQSIYGIHHNQKCT
jgi:radical SAM superfamily enzyme YgiQ (UPF0313 family)